MSDDETTARDDRSREDRPLSDQERADLYREQLKKLHVVDLVRDMMVTLVTVGYEKLGLTEQTRELRDLGDARVAIESLRRLIEVVEGEGDPEGGSLRSTLAQMQLNFARASAESPRPTAARPAPAPTVVEQPPTTAEQPPVARSSQNEGSEAEAHPHVEHEAEPAMAPGAPAGQSRRAAAGEAPARKPATKKPVAKKPAAKKPAAKKPDARKPAAQDPATRKPTAAKPAPKARTRKPAKPGPADAG